MNTLRMGEHDIVVHVGLPRTATTFLQNRIFTQLKSVSYLGKTEESYPEWLLNWHYLDDYAYDRSLPLLKNRIGELMAAAERFLLSSEMFTMWGGGAPRQARRLADIIPQARIILVIRDPIDRLMSFYKYCVLKDHFIDSLESSLEWRRTPYVYYKAKKIYLPDFIIDETTEIYRSIFGAANVLVVRYEDLVQTPSAFVDSILDWIDDGIVADLNDVDMSRVNASCDEAEVEAARRDNILRYLNCLNHETDAAEPGSTIAVSTRSPLSNDLRVRLIQYFRGRSAGYY
jgi:hypothetical protein